MNMTGFLDTFQLMIAGYLFYAAFKGNGNLYNYPGVPKEKRAGMRKNLRKFYFWGGIIALLDTAASMLQSAMFTVNYTETGQEITQNFTIEALPFLTYDMLSTISLSLSIGLMLLFVILIIYTRKLQNDK